MRLNQVTVTMADLDAGWRFYCTLGLKPIVDARPRYARFVCPDGDSTFSLYRGENGGGGTSIYFECENVDETVCNLKEAGLGFVSDPEDKSWLWREAELFDPGGNRIILYFAGPNRIDPPWRVTRLEERRIMPSSCKVYALNKGSGKRFSSNIPQFGQDAGASCQLLSLP